MAHGDKKNKSKVDTGDICAVALLQADECPLRDEERLIAGSAKHLSFLHRGKMLIPHGLFRSKYLALVFLSLPHSDQCGGDLPKTNVSRHSVKLTLETIPPGKIRIFQPSCILGALSMF